MTPLFFILKVWPNLPSISNPPPRTDEYIVNVQPAANFNPQEYLPIPPPGTIQEPQDAPQSPRPPGWHDSFVEVMPLPQDNAEEQDNAEITMNKVYFKL